MFLKKTLVHIDTVTVESINNWLQVQFDDDIIMDKLLSVQFFGGG